MTYRQPEQKLSSKSSGSEHNSVGFLSDFCSIIITVIFVVLSLRQNAIFNRFRASRDPKRLGYGRGYLIAPCASGFSKALNCFLHYIIQLVLFFFLFLICVRVYLCVGVGGGLFFSMFTQVLLGWYFQAGNKRFN